MTRTMSLAVVGTLAAVLLEPGLAFAQRPAGPPRTTSPTVSPYLNLVRRGTIPAVNYYGLVRPEQEMRRNLQSMQRQVYQNRSDLDAMAVGADPGMPVTGKAAMFLNTSGYFMTFSPAGGSGFGTFGVTGPASPGMGGGAARPPASSRSSPARR